MNPARLNTPVRFDSRPDAAGGGDGYGNKRAEFAPGVTRQAEVIPLRGGEAIVAARLQGRTVIQIKVRKDPETALVTRGHRVVVSAVGPLAGTYDLKDVTDARDERPGQYLSMLAESLGDTGAP